jgi:hypothetical protein
VKPPRKPCCAEHAADLEACLRQFYRWLTRRKAEPDDPPAGVLRERWVRKWYGGR